MPKMMKRLTLLIITLTFLLKSTGVGCLPSAAQPDQATLRPMAARRSEVGGQMSDSRLLPDEDKIRQRFKPPAGQSLVILQRKGDEIAPGFRPSTEFKSYLYPELVETDHSHREAVIAALYERKVDITSLKKTADWEAFPEDLKAYLKKQIVLVTANPETTTLKKSRYSVLMYKGKTEDYSGRLGILLLGGVPIIGELEGKEFVLEAKGIGAADKGFMSAHIRSANFYEVTGGFDARESKREFEKLEKDRRQNPLFAKGELPRAALEVHFILPEIESLVEAAKMYDWQREGFLEEFQNQVAILFRWTPSTKRAAFDLKKKDIYMLGRTTARALPNMHPFPHPENLLIWGEDDSCFCFQDRGHIEPVIIDFAKEDWHALKRMSYAEHILRERWAIYLFDRNAELYLKLGIVQDKEEFFNEFKRGFKEEAKEAGLPADFIKGLSQVSTPEEFINYIWDNYFTVVGYRYYKQKGYFKKGLPLTQSDPLCLEMFEIDILYKARTRVEKDNEKMLAVFIDNDAHAILAKERELLRRVEALADSGLIKGKKREIYIVTNGLTRAEKTQYKEFFNTDIAEWASGLGGAMTIRTCTASQLKQMRPQENTERLFIMTKDCLKRNFNNSIRRIDGRILLLAEPDMPLDENHIRIIPTDLLFQAIGMICLSKDDLPDAQAGFGGSEFYKLILWFSEKTSPPARPDDLKKRRIDKQFFVLRATLERGVGLLRYIFSQAKKESSDFDLFYYEVISGLEKGFKSDDIRAVINAGISLCVLANPEHGSRVWESMLEIMTEGQRPDKLTGLITKDYLDRKRTKVKQILSDGINSENLPTRIGAAFFLILVHFPDLQEHFSPDERGLLMEIAITGLSEEDYYLSKYSALSLLWLGLFEAIYRIPFQLEPAVYFSDLSDLFLYEKIGMVNAQLGAIDAIITFLEATVQPDLPADLLDYKPSYSEHIIAELIPPAIEILHRVCGQEEFSEEKYHALLNLHRLLRLNVVTKFSGELQDELEDLQTQLITDLRGKFEKDRADYYAAVLAQTEDLMGPELKSKIFDILHKSLGKSIIELQGGGQGARVFRELAIMEDAFVDLLTESIGPMIYRLEDDIKAKAVNATAKIFIARLLMQKFPYVLLDRHEMRARLPHILSEGLKSKEPVVAAMAASVIVGLGEFRSLREGRKRTNRPENILSAIDSAA